MGMQLNIKSDEAYRMAAELAELTGQSLTAIVTHAIRERLETEHKTRERESKKQRILALAAEIRADLTKDGQRPDLSADFLYDDQTGLPV